MKALKATYDGEKVLFEEKIDLPKNSKLIVILLEEEEPEWYSLSYQNLNRAYGE